MNKKRTRTISSRKKHLPYFKSALVVIVLAAGYLQYNAGKADAMGYSRDNASRIEAERAALFDQDPDALARTLNMIEPSN